MPYPEWVPAPFIIHNYLMTGVTEASEPTVSSAFTTANSMIGYPFVVEQKCVLYKAWWMNGSSVGSNHEVALYDWAFVKLAATGSTAGSGSTNAPQTVDWTDAPIGPGLYYAVYAQDSSTANRIGGNARDFYTCRCWSQASITLGSLPAIATPTTTFSVMPLFGFITRSNFDI